MPAFPLTWGNEGYYDTMDNFQKELVNDLMPTVENKFSTYAKSTTDEGFKASRGHRAMAPIAPFLSDEMYKKLTGKETVHTAYYPECNEALIDKNVEERMDLVRSIATLGRGIREKESIKVRQPLYEILVDGKYKKLISDMRKISFRRSMEISLMKK